MIPQMNEQEANQIRLRLRQRAARLSRNRYDPKQVERMRWRVAGTLDKWLTKELRRVLIDYLFAYGDGGSTKQLTGAELAAMLEWMSLGYDSLNGDYDTSKSLEAKEQMRRLCMVVQPPLPKMVADLATSGEMEVHG